MPLPAGFLALCATVLLRLQFCRDVVSGPFFCMCPLGGEISAIKGLSMPSGRRLHSEHVNLSRCLCPHLFFFLASDVSYTPINTFKINFWYLIRNPQLFSLEGWSENAVCPAEANRRPTIQFVLCVCCSSYLKGYYLENKQTWKEIDLPGPQQLWKAMGR